MPRTFIRSAEQIAQSDSYDDTLTLSEAESGATSLEADLNFLRSKIKALHGASDWFSAVADSFHLQAVHDKRFTYWIQKADDVAVPSSQNYVLLTGATKPSDVIAYGSTALGAITAKISGADVGAHSLAVATNTANLCEIRLAGTNEEISTATGSYKIYALLQVGQNATDGVAFENDDTNSNQGQLSFVYFNPATEAVTACPVADIEGKTVEFAYRKRVTFYGLPENAFDPGITFIESTAIATVDLQVAYNNDADGEIDLSSAKNFSIDLNGNADFEIKDSSNSKSYLLADQSAGEILVGVPLAMRTANPVRFYDSDNSNYVGFVAPALTANTTYTLPSADGTNKYVLSTNGSGTLSWAYVGDNLNTKKATYVVPSLISADTAISLSSFTNPDSMAFGAVAATWVKNFDVYINGVLMYSGVDEAADTDVYYVDNTTFKSNTNIKQGAIITIVERK